jgi:tripartite-type tricarboxylate transporter receptor subunit TctC
MQRRSLIRCAAFAPLVLPLAARAQAGYPTRPVKLVVAFEPGGSTDLTARLVGQKLSEKLGQPFVIENRAGAGSNIGSEAVARAPADGYTLLMGTISAAVNMSLYKDLRFNLMTDFAPITIVSKSPAILVVHPKVPVRTLKEFIAYAKSRPGKLNYASSGTGNTPHLAMEMLKQRTGIDIAHVPYKGAGPALRDQLSGVVDAGIVTALSAVPSIQAGQLRALAVTSSKRLSILPDLPTFGELGIPDFEITSWNGLFAPARTSPAIVQTLNAAWAQASQLPDVQKTFSDQASLALASTPDEFRAFVQQEIKTWGDIIESVKVEKL